MAREKGKYGRSADTASYGANILKDINRMSSTGDTTAAPGTTDGTAVRKNKLADTSTPYTSTEISSNPVFSALKRGITPEEAIKNYRAFVKVNNMAPVAGAGKITNKQNRQYQRAYGALTPEQRPAERILTTLGIKIEDAQGNLVGGYSDSDRQTILNKLGIDSSSTPAYGNLRVDTGKGLKQTVANPLKTAQKARLQKLNLLAKSGSTLTATQVAARARLKAKKNAPTILP